VRKDEPRLLRDVGQWLVSNRAAVDGLLAQYGVPRA
jgi:hypothetical protein